MEGISSELESEQRTEDMCYYTYKLMIQMTTGRRFSHCSQLYCHKVYEVSLIIKHHAFVLELLVT